MTQEPDWAQGGVLSDRWHSRVRALPDIAVLCGRGPVYVSTLNFLVCTDADADVS